MKKQPLRGTTLTAAPDVLADRGEVALRQGRFKEAMEVFKQLARLDPRPEWTHRLADAYAGRAHALANKGMFKEAALVLENTLSAETICEPLLYLTVWSDRDSTRRRSKRRSITRTNCRRLRQAVLRNWQRL